MRTNLADLMTLYHRIVVVLPVGKITFGLVQLKKLEIITSLSYAII
jgi:hypothetical protein